MSRKSTSSMSANILTSPRKNAARTWVSASAPCSVGRASSMKTTVISPRVAPVTTLPMSRRKSHVLSVSSAMLRTPSMS